MAVATTTAIALALAAASAGLQYQNTRRTAQKQDNALADSIRNQSARQRVVDSKVNDEVRKLEASRSNDERATALQNYTQTLKRNAGALQQGLTPGVGSDTFKADAAQASTDATKYAGDTAGLMARVDAPNMQRQGEAFSRGMLGTDIDVESRGARGQAFLDELRLRGIRRSPWMDAAATMASSYAGGMAGGAMGGAGMASGGATAGAGAGGSATWRWGGGG